ncbi:MULTISPECIES: hypothetical protein [Rhodanobacter]|uniref:Uncharacterized protein n=1 Tax=Rhodanobacter denitrificans TaxID=666685 RepID=M4NHP8_9GAMM|nr:MULTISPECIES: hypothetical protein [Rhodanobacter]AGG87351.1 hypothetical protein R2APBS1_0172 [Rhodanobacter denitrificans]UJJ51265.1 hypothetical protein LRK52_00815 [Rhodanobacter denitrificans]UJJ59949.1 hypothetical protein LRK55_07405 [Rhodanobacter denitrificans]UJM86535.1 hypothetical protein LRJ86_17440 [Rhodanobacter denitrificans]UJM90481.1 hypothetical protein LRK24_00830 [Rhodanobacter denitrificans]
MNRMVAGLSLVPVGLLLTVLGLLFSNDLGRYKYVLLSGAVFVLLCSILLILLSLIRKS